MQYPVSIIAGGVTLWVAILCQMLIGKRVIRFKGRLHARVHAAVGWALILLATLHAVLAVSYLTGWPLRLN